MGASTEQEPFDGFLIRGKFTDDSTSADWQCRIDGKVVDLTPYVNPDTKEFEYQQISKPTTLVQLFFNNHCIEEIYDISGTEKVTLFDSMFENSDRLKSFKAPSIQTFNVVSMKNLFRYCKVLTSLDVSNFDTRNVEDFSIAFGGLHAIKFLDLSSLDTSKNKTFFGILNSNWSLEEVIVNWDFISDTTNPMLDQGIDKCKSDMHILGNIKNISKNIYVTGLMPNDSAMLFINGLDFVEKPQTITFHSTTYNNLTPEQIALAESKNWIVAHA